MENLKLLFIEGNRQNIDKENIKACYNKIKSLGFIKTMPIEYIPMDEAIGKIGGRKLFKVTVERNIGNGGSYYQQLQNSSGSSCFRRLF